MQCMSESREDGFLIASKLGVDEPRYSRPLFLDPGSYVLSFAPKARASVHALQRIDPGLSIERKNLFLRETVFPYCNSFPGARAQTVRCVLFCDSEIKHKETRCPCKCFKILCSRV